jgi:(p)ppGpp synthase/HD superfamily hydrolase
MNWSQETYAKAYHFTARAHHGQKFPGTELPYLVHVSLVCMEVVAALQAEPSREGNLAVQCALLHDVIEDTDITYEQVKAEFGAVVADGVLALTKNEALEKSLQMGDSLRRIQDQPHEVWMVKLADRISNLEEPPYYWQSDKIARYRQEARHMSGALHPAIPVLAARLAQKIEDYQRFEGVRK